MRKKDICFIAVIFLISSQSYAQVVPFNANGKDGTDGSRPSGYSTSPGAGIGSGSNGPDASRSTPGQAGGSTRLILEDKGSADKATIVIRSSIQRAGESAQTAVQSFPVTPSGPRITVSANGGKGGNGGHGGDGQGGENGKDGANATKTSNGKNGTDGKAGGQGGDGTPGSNGGRGGDTIIPLSSDDLHLAFLIDSIEARGGEGGEAGRNGSGGKGGRGGSGGKSLEWEEYIRSDPVKQENPDGSVTIVEKKIYEKRSKSGGSSGSSGTSARDGNGSTRAGSKGEDGKFEFQVTDQSGKVSRYTSVSSLKLVSYQIEELDPETRDGIPEAKERLSIKNIVVKNAGGMPSPEGRADVLFRLPQADWLRLPEKSIVIPSLQPGQSFNIPQSYDIQIASLVPNGQGQRWVRNVSIDPESSVPRVFYKYPNFSLPKSISITVPLEISDIQMPETLAAGERASISFRVKNISTKPLGLDSAGKRSIDIAISQTTQQNLPFLFKPKSGDEQSETQISLASGYAQKILQLAPGQEITIEGQISVPPSIEPYSSVNFRNDLKFPEYGGTAVQVVQQNNTKLRIGSKFKHTPGSDLLLITNTNTERSEVLAWTALANKLGLKLDVWDTSYYGYLNLKKDLDNMGSTLMQYYGRRTIILLNNQSDRAKTRMGSDSLDAQEFVEAASRKLMNFYVIGGQGGTGFLKWLMTTDPVSRGEIKDPAKMDQYKQAHADFIHDIKVAKPTDRDWSKQANKLSASLYGAYPQQRFVLECPTNSGAANFGEIVVRATIDPVRGRASYFSKAEEDVHTEAFVNSEANIRGLILNLPFEKKLTMLKKLYSSSQSPELPNLNIYLQQAITHDIVEEIELRRRVEDKSHKDSQVARHFQLYMAYLKYRIHLTKDSPEWQMQNLAETIAGLDMYLDSMPDTKLEDNLRKNFDTWIEENWSSVFGPQADKAKTELDKSKDAIEKKIDDRENALVGLDDTENMRHLLIYPAKRELKTTDEILRDGNLIDKP